MGQDIRAPTVTATLQNPKSNGHLCLRRAEIVSSSTREIFAPEKNSSSIISWSARATKSLQYGLWSSFFGYLEELSALESWSSMLSVLVFRSAKVPQRSMPSFARASYLFLDYPVFRGGCFFVRSSASTRKSYTCI